jgi:hypothetical protein
MRRKKGKHWSVGSEFGHERFESFLLRCCTRCCFHLSLVPFLSSFIPRCSRYSTLPHGRQIANVSSPLLISCSDFRCMHRFVGFMFDARMNLLLVLSMIQDFSSVSLSKICMRALATLPVPRHPSCSFAIPTSSIACFFCRSEDDGSLIVNVAGKMPLAPLSLLRCRLHHCVSCQSCELVC